MARPKDSPLIGCCGIYCGACPSNTGITREAAKKLKIMLDEAKTGEISFLMGIADKYPTFHEVLTLFANQPLCSGCGSESPTASCAIRKCCLEQGISSCAECEKLEDCTKAPEGFDLNKAIGEAMGKAFEEVLQEEQSGPPELPELPKEIFMQIIKGRYHDWNIENLRMIKSKGYAEWLKKMEEDVKNGFYTGHVIRDEKEEK
ncbi:MAG: DUF3795 domain-containing protein [Candidatus Lokiarchaeia archaeon]